MKRMLITVAFFAGLICFCKTTEAQTGGAVKSNLIQRIDDKNIRVTEGAVVPAKIVYYIYDEGKNKLLATYQGGQAVTTLFRKKTQQTKNRPKINCAKIPCPSTFTSTVDCWECH